MSGLEKLSWFPEQLDRLRCPHCLAENRPDVGRLRACGDTWLVSDCGRRFPVRDGIPILMLGDRGAAAEVASADPPDLSVIIPALNEGPNLALLLPQLRAVLDRLGISYEILIVTSNADVETVEATTRFGAKLLEQNLRGYGGALRTAFRAACGRYLLSMDADLSHQPIFISEMWRRREEAEVTIASRYVPGGSARMPLHRYLLSRLLNIVFSRGLSLQVRDMSSGFRLLKADVARSATLDALDFDVVQELLVRAYADGWRVQEIPMEYAPRAGGSSHARILAFGMAYMRRFWSLWKLRNSILSADYDDRAHDSPIPLQRYWQRMRFKHVKELIAGEGSVLDVGCGSSRIITTLPPGSIGVDVLLRKLRYARKFGTALVQASGCELPFRDESFPCVLSSQVIEHVPKEAAFLDELCRVVMPGGRLVLGTPDYASRAWLLTEKLYGLFAPGGYADEHIAHYTYSDLVRLMRERGFVAEDRRYILRGELIMAFRKVAAA